MTRLRRWPTPVGLLVILSFVISACGAAATPTPVPPAPSPTAESIAAPTPVPAASPTAAPAATLAVANNATIGDILVDARGMTLYTYKKDTPGVSNCYDTCAQNWPPLLVKAGEQPVASAGISGKLGVTQRTDGTYQVTYNDMPLYGFIKDTKPGDTTGQGVGNVWYVVPTGASGSKQDLPPSSTY
jgi:predicted lipoprotein with Yx(FWY)xxD motif